MQYIPEVKRVYNAYNAPFIYKKSKNSIKFQSALMKIFLL